MLPGMTRLQTDRPPALPESYALALLAANAGDGRGLTWPIAPHRPKVHHTNFFQAKNSRRCVMEVNVCTFYVKRPAPSVQQSQRGVGPLERDPQAR